MANYVLEILDGDRAGDVLPVGDAVLRIGRKSGNDLVLADEKTSGVHCEIAPEADRLVLKDLGSTNGTFLDGKRITEVVLTPGDVVTVGRLRVKFRAEGDDAAAADDAGEFSLRKLDAASVSRVVIERPAQTARVIIHTARPGIVIGKKGEDVEKLRQDLSAKMGVPVHINIEEIRKPDLDARLVAQNVAQQLERRVMFRRAMKRVVQNAMRQGAEGIKVQVGGRLGGAEIARTEWYREGRVPLHTLRADIDYATYEAHTTYGVIGVKVWIFKGEVIGAEDEGQDPRRSAAG